MQSLVRNFEKVIQDWNCLRKLKNRDKELSEIKAQVEQIEKFVDTEYTYIDQEIKYYDNKMAKNPED